ncbi:MAG: BsuPI-related putative proteinase inhibitor [Heyndrickxia sp.]
MKKLISFLCLMILFFPKLTFATGKDDPSMVSWEAKLRPYADHLEINLIVRNDSEQAIQLEFPTSKMYDFSIMDEKREVFRFSKGKYYLQAFQFVKLQSGEEKVWTINWDYKSKGKRLSSGKYTLIARLLPSKINGMPSSQQLVTKQDFEIPALHEIHIEGKAGDYTVSGNADSSSENYYYSVDDGHHLLIKKKAIRIIKDAFQVSFHLPNEIVTENESLIFSILNSKDEPIFIQSLKK